MRKAARFSVCLFLALAALSRAQLPAEDFQIEGRKLSGEECAQVKGGLTDIYVNEGRTRAVVTSIPEDRYGRDYSRAQSYAVEVQNNISQNLAPSPKDKYRPEQFPRGTATLDVAKIVGAAKGAKFGSSNGEWITTDATRTVTAYPVNSAGNADMSKPYTRLDSGYFWHTNNEKGFKASVSWGCLISRKGDIDRVIATLKADWGKKKITVR